MKFKNPSLFFVRTDGPTDGQAQSNMPLQLFQSWGHENLRLLVSSLNPDQDRKNVGTDLDQKAFGSDNVPELFKVFF